MRRVSLWKSAGFRYSCSVLKGLFWMIPGSLGIARLMQSGTIPAQALVWMIHILWSICAFAAARCAGFHGRKHGIRTGLLCSLALCVFLLAGMLLLHESFSRRLLVRILLMLVSGMAGGIAGVNTRLRKPPY